MKMPALGVAIMLVFGPVVAVADGGNHPTDDQ
jgi:hypothetical protein